MGGGRLKKDFTSLNRRKRPTGFQTMNNLHQNKRIKEDNQRSILEPIRHSPSSIPIPIPTSRPLKEIFTNSERPRLSHEGPLSHPVTAPNSPVEFNSGSDVFSKDRRFTPEPKSWVYMPHKSLQHRHSKKLDHVLNAFSTSIDITKNQLDSTPIVSLHLDSINFNGIVFDTSDGDLALNVSRGFQFLYLTRKQMIINNLVIEKAKHLESLKFSTTKRSILIELKKDYGYIQVQYSLDDSQLFNFFLLQKQWNVKPSPRIDNDDLLHRMNEIDSSRPQTSKTDQSPKYREANDPIRPRTRAHTNKLLPVTSENPDGTVSILEPGESVNKETVVHPAEIPAPFDPELKHKFSGNKTFIITYSDFKTLYNNDWINDSVIDFFIQYEIEKAIYDRKLFKESEIYAFNSFFFTKLMSKLEGQENVDYYGNIKRWLSKLDLLSFPYVILPICENMHWYCCIIKGLPNLLNNPQVPKDESLDQNGNDQEDNENDDTLDDLNSDPIEDLQQDEKSTDPDYNDSKSNSLPSKQSSSNLNAPPKKKYVMEIYVFDSLSQKHTNIVRPLKEFIVEYCKDKHNLRVEKEQIRVIAAKVPKQNNFNDCGIHVIYNVRKWLNDAEKCEQVWRCKSKYLIKSFFLSAERNNMRKELIDTLLELHDKQDLELKEKKNSPEADNSKNNETSEDDIEVIEYKPGNSVETEADKKETSSNKSIPAFTDPKKDDILNTTSKDSPTQKPSSLSASKLTSFDNDSATQLVPSSELENKSLRELFNNQSLQLRNLRLFNLIFGQKFDHFNKYQGQLILDLEKALEPAQDVSQREKKIAHFKITFNALGGRNDPRINTRPLDESLVIQHRDDSSDDLNRSVHNLRISPSLPSDTQSKSHLDLTKRDNLEGRTLDPMKALVIPVSQVVLNSTKIEGTNNNKLVNSNSEHQRFSSDSQNQLKMEIDSSGLFDFQPRLKPLLETVDIEMKDILDDEISRQSLSPKVISSGVSKPITIKDQQKGSADEPSPIFGKKDAMVESTPMRKKSSEDVKTLDVESVKEESDKAIMPEKLKLGSNGTGTDELEEISEKRFNMRKSPIPNNDLVELTIQTLSHNNNSGLKKDVLDDSKSSNIERYNKDNQDLNPTRKGSDISHSRGSEDKPGKMGISESLNTISNLNPVLNLGNRVEYTEFDLENEAHPLKIDPKEANWSKELNHKESIDSQSPSTSVTGIDKKEASFSMDLNGDHKVHILQQNDGVSKTDLPPKGKSENVFRSHPNRVQSNEARLEKTREHSRRFNESQRLKSSSSQALHAANIFSLFRTDHLPEKPKVYRPSSSPAALTRSIPFGTYNPFELKSSQNNGRRNHHSNRGSNSSAEAFEDSRSASHTKETNTSKGSQKRQKKTYPLKRSEPFNFRKRTKDIDQRLDQDLQTIKSMRHSEAHEANSNLEGELFKNSNTSLPQSVAEKKTPTLKELWRKATPEFTRKVLAESTRDANGGSRMAQVKRDVSDKSNSSSSSPKLHENPDTEVDNSESNTKLIGGDSSISATNTDSDVEIEIEMMADPSGPYQNDDLRRIHTRYDGSPRPRARQLRFLKNLPQVPTIAEFDLSRAKNKEKDEQSNRIMSDHSRSSRKKTLPIEKPKPVPIRIESPDTKQTHQTLSRVRRTPPSREIHDVDNDLNYIDLASDALTDIADDEEIDVQVLSSSDEEESKRFRQLKHQNTNKNTTDEDHHGPNYEIIDGNESGGIQHLDSDYSSGNDRNTRSQTSRKEKRNNDKQTYVIHSNGNHHTIFTPIQVSDSSDDGYEGVHEIQSSPLKGPSVNKVTSKDPPSINERRAKLKKRRLNRNGFQ